MKKPSTNKARRREAFTGELARTYEKRRETKDHESLEWWIEDAAVTAWLAALPKGAKVLDAPVGTGRFLPFYDRWELEAKGVDKSPDMLKEARKKKASAVLACGSVFEMLLAEKFSAVVCVRFFEHCTFAETALLLRKFANVLEPGGVLLGTVHTWPDHPSNTNPEAYTREEFLNAAYSFGLHCFESIPVSRRYGDNRVAFRIKKV